MLSKASRENTWRSEDARRMDNRIFYFIPLSPSTFPAWSVISLIFYDFACPVLVGATLRKYARHARVVRCEWKTDLATNLTYRGIVSYNRRTSANLRGFWIIRNFGIVGKIYRILYISRVISRYSSQSRYTNKWPINLRFRRLYNIYIIYMKEISFFLNKHIGEKICMQLLMCSSRVHIFEISHILRLMIIQWMKKNEMKTKQKNYI